MRNVCFLIIALLVTATPPLHGQTQIELNQTAGSELEKADAELNKVYQDIIRLYADDKAFIKQLRIAQRAWLKFRDTHLETVFPKENKRLEYGSAYPLCYSYAQAELTRARTKQLRKWLFGTVEGDLCSGSVKLTYDLQEKGIKN